MISQGTPKNRAKIENEIEKHREEGNWNRCLDLAQQLSSDQPSLFHFLTGEAKLEKYLETGKEQTNKSLVEDAQNHLKLCLETSSTSPLIMDANLLMAKLSYVSVDYAKALNHIEQSGIDNISSVEKALPLRVMKLVAESLAVKGMSLEQLKVNDNIDVQISCLCKSSDLGIRYMQNLEKQQGPYMVASLGSILELAIQRAPIVYIKNKQMDKACEQYRIVLNACETPSTLTARQILSRQLAEVITRGVSSKSWKKPSINLTSSSPKPLKPIHYIGQSLFVPREREEEIVLLLMLSEMLASRNVVLDRSCEFNSARTQSLHNVMSVYDLFTIAMTPFNCYLTDMFERSMKFSFELKHIWFQFALSLIESKKSPVRALLILKEVSRIDKDDPLPNLLAAKLCILELNLYQEALELAMESLKRCKDDILKSKICLIIGVSNALIFENETETGKKRNAFYLNDSLDYLQKSLKNSMDNLPQFHIALHLAHQRAINDAIHHAKISLAMNPQHLPTLQLLILSLSALKQHQEALNICEATLEEYPGHLILLYIKSHLEEAVYENGQEIALLTAKEMLNCWRVINLDERKRCSYISNNYFACLNYDSLSIRMEQTLSEVASLDSGVMQQDSGNNLFVSAANKSMWTLHIHIWLLIVEMFIKLGQINEAESCVSDVANCVFGSLSHHLMYIKGILCKSKGQFVEAKTHFQNTISINPNHAKALQQLGHTYYLLGNFLAAEKYLKDSLNVDATLHETWSYMGLTHHAFNDFDRSADCQTTALRLEMTAPILPFSTVSRAVLD